MFARWDVRWRSGAPRSEGFRSRGKNRSPRMVSHPGAPHTGYPEPRDSLPRSSSRRRRLTVASLGRANGSSGFDPQAAWPGRKVHQCECCGSDRVADRPSALHAEAPHRRGWSTRLAPSVRAGVSSPDHRAPEPLFASAPSPEFPPGPALKAWWKRWASPLPLKARERQYRAGREPRKCRCFFGLAHFNVNGVWKLRPADLGVSEVHPHDVELCIHSVHVPTSTVSWPAGGPPPSRRRSGRPRIG